jgi:hypothetical protein
MDCNCCDDPSLIAFGLYRRKIRFAVAEYSMDQNRESRPGADCAGVDPCQRGRHGASSRSPRAERDRIQNDMVREGALKSCPGTSTFNPSILRAQLLPGK